MTANFVALAKRTLPRGSKELLRKGFRQYGEATATWRPLPDFLIIGTKRGGTTSLWNYLLEHPLVVPMFPASENLKSNHYFYWHYARGEDWYRSYFATNAHRSRLQRKFGGPTMTGEASPYYLYDPRVPARVRADLPNAKIIILLRNPVERAYSQYKDRIKIHGETLSFPDALAVEPERLEGEMERMLAEPDYYSRPHDYFSYRDRGIYRPQVERWLDEFPREQVLIVRSEDFYADPAAAYSRTLAFLGLPDHQLQNPKRFNYVPAADMDEATRQELTEFYRPHNAELAKLLDTDFGWD
jgi:hypothetical protein